MIILVKQPTFLINLDNPIEVSYEPKEGNWKTIISQTYQFDIPEPKENEILYKFSDKRGYIYKNKVMNKVEIDIETFRGIWLILCGVSYNHSGAEVNENAIPLMNKSHKEIIEIGEKLGFDIRGYDIK